MCTACSSLNIEAARQLAVTGRQTAVQAKQSSVVSGIEFSRAIDGEAMFHGFSGTPDTLKPLVSLYDDVRREFTARSIVFDELAQLYDAFGDLAGIDAAQEVETALGQLNGAITAYAKQMNLSPPVSGDTANAIAKIGGLVAGEIQKAKIKKASTLIRGEVEEFGKLLGNPLVRTQITSFRELLQKNAAAALIMLWEGGALDPKPILDDMGSPAGLTASKEAEKVLTNKPLLKNGLTLVLEQRLSRQSNLIDQTYAASLQALNRLAAEHKKLEEDQELDLARLRQTAAELRTLVELITKIKSGVAG
jgi:hypothetical protein